MNPTDSQPTPLQTVSAPILPKVFDMLKSAWLFYKQNIRILIPYLAVIVACSAINMLVRPENGTFAAYSAASGLHPALIAVLATIISIISAIASVALIKAIVDIRKGTRIGFKTTILWIFKNILPLLWVMILVVTATLGSYALLIVPGVILSVFTMFSALAFLDENYRGLEALSRSYRLVKGDWWGVVLRVFGVGVICGLCMIPVVIATVIIMVGIGAMHIAFLNIAANILLKLVIAVAAYGVMVPVVQVAVTDLYLNLKHTKGSVIPSAIETPDSSTFRFWAIAMSVLGFLMVATMIAGGIYLYRVGLPAMKNIKTPVTAAVSSNIIVSTSTSLTAYQADIKKLSPKAYTNTKGGYQINLPVGWQGVIDADSGDTVGMKAGATQNSGTAATIMVHSEVLPEKIDLTNQNVQEGIAGGIVDQFLLNGSEQIMMERVSSSTIMSEMRNSPISPDTFFQTVFINYGSDRIDLVLVTSTKGEWEAVKRQLYASALTFKLTK